MKGEKVGHSLSLGNQREGHRIQKTEAQLFLQAQNQ